MSLQKSIVDLIFIVVIASGVISMAISVFIHTRTVENKVRTKWAREDVYYRCTERGRKEIKPPRFRIEVNGKMLTDSDPVQDKWYRRELRRRR